MDYEDNVFDNISDPLQRDLKNFMENIPEAQELRVRKGVHTLLLRFQNAILLLIQHGDWPHLSFPIVFDQETMTSAKEIFGATSEDLDCFYERARDCFEKENYDDASDICLLLSKLDPLEPTYWVALGMCEQLKGKYQAAASAYAAAIDLNRDDLTPGLYAARCLVDLGEVSLARALLVELLNVEVETEEGSFFAAEAAELISELEGKL